MIDIQKKLQERVCASNKDKALQASLLAYKQYCNWSPKQLSIAETLINRNPTELEIAQEAERLALIDKGIQQERKLAEEAKKQRRINLRVNAIVEEYVDRDMRRYLINAKELPYNCPNAYLCKMYGFEYDQITYKHKLYLEWEKLMMKTG